MNDDYDDCADELERRRHEDLLAASRADAREREREHNRNYEIANLASSALPICVVGALLVSRAPWPHAVGQGAALAGIIMWIGALILRRQK